MEERNAMIGILLIAAISLASYFVVANGLAGAATSENYRSCCCNILAQDDGNQYLVRSQVQMHAADCSQACLRYRKGGQVFSQDGLCQENP